MKKALKWIGIIILIFMLLPLFMLISPIVLILSLISIYIFNKWRPNAQYARYAKRAAIVSGAGLILIVTAIIMSDNESDPQADEEETIVKVEAEDKEAEDQKKKEEEQRIEAEKKKKEAERKEKEEAERKEKEEAERKEKEEAERKEKEEAERKVEEKIKAGTLKVHFINVGQGDSTFISLPNGESVLIDGGTRGSGSTVRSYLNGLNINKIDYVIATHPHEDHIGGLIEVINNFDIGTVYMPDKVHTTIVFEDLLKAIDAKGKSINTLEAGDTIISGEHLNLNTVAPSSNVSGSNLNNFSIVNRLVFNNISFLFTGDIEDQVESSLVGSDFTLESDVLKVPHHGGNTSSSEALLNRVKPKHAVISAGSNNQYGHPHNDVIYRLNTVGANIYRTDIEGTIVATSDGNSVTFDKNTSNEITSNTESNSETGSGSSSESGSNSQSSTNTGAGSGSQSSSESAPINSSYLANANTMKFHKASCGHAKRIANHNRVEFDSRDGAVGAGYQPCKVCKP